ncbi:MAG: S41 family peptidase [Planctomycetota bacterium]
MPNRNPLPELTFAVGFACGLLTLSIVYALLPAPVDRDVELLRAVRDLTQETYVEEVDSRTLIDGALRGMVGNLDRYSRYYGPEEIAGIDRETSGEYLGIGVLFLDAEEGRIRFPLAGSPAERAGLRVGDRIVAVDGARVDAMPEGGLRDSLKRRSGEPIELELLGRDAEVRTATLRPEPVVDPSVRHARMLDDELGYLAIVSFSHRTLEEFDRWTAWLSERGMQGLILDLRSNPGGILDAAIRIADRFIPDGVLVSTRSRTETRSTRARAEETHLLGLPLVVLVDGDSASASEVLCGALQDHRVGVVVGEETYGKGAVQTLSRFEHEQAIIKLTTSSYFTPAGRRIERGSGWTGLAPDVWVALPAGQRRAIHGFLRLYSPPPAAVPELRAWEEEEGLTLIAEAPDDPQLDAAIGLLRGRSPGPVAVRHVD